MPAAGSPQWQPDFGFPDWVAFRSPLTTGGKAGGNDEHLCTSAGGHRLEETAKRAAHPVDVIPKCAHFESPRQEEQRSNSRRGENRTIQRSRSHPLAARSVGLSRAPAPILEEPANRPCEVGHASRSAGEVKWFV